MCDFQRVQEEYQDQDIDLVNNDYRLHQLPVVISHVTHLAPVLHSQKYASDHQYADCVDVYGNNQNQRLTLDGLSNLHAQFDTACQENGK